MKALAAMAQWIQCRPVNQMVAGSIPNQGTCLGCGQGPQEGGVRGNHTVMFFSLSPSLLLSLKINKQNLKKKKKKGNESLKMGSKIRKICEIMQK